MSTSGGATAEFDAFLEKAAANPAIVGVVLTGSRGRGLFVRPDSDWDLRAVVRDEDFADVADALATAHGTTVEVAVFSLRSFTVMGKTPETAWDRYSYVHVQVLIDKLDGHITELVREKAELTEPESVAMASAALGGYINSYFRAIKNARSGLPLGTRLDAAESVSPLLTALFAMNRRVRPFNRHLEWELREFPLPVSLLAADQFLPRLDAVLAGDMAAQAALFRDIEAVARDRGLGEVIDGWEPDVELLRRAS